MKNILLISIISLFSSCVTLWDGTSYSATQNKEENTNDEIIEKLLPLLSFEDKESLSISKDFLGDYTIRDSSNYGIIKMNNFVYLPS